MARNADIAVITAIPVELDSALKAFEIRSLPKKIDGTNYWEKTIFSQRTKIKHKMVLSCIVDSGNVRSAIETLRIIKAYRPKVVILIGIAAGINRLIKIGEVVFAERVFAYEKEALQTDKSGKLRKESRADTLRWKPSIAQDVGYYLTLVDKKSVGTRVKYLFKKIGGKFPSLARANRNRRRRDIASDVAVKMSTVASGEKLLRWPDKLRLLRRFGHGKIEVGEMEGHGFAESCERENVNWLLIRGISDFGNKKKTDDFHKFASRMAASVAKDFILYGLHISSRTRYGRNRRDIFQELSEELDQCHRQRRSLLSHTRQLGLLIKKVPNVINKENRHILLDKCIQITNHRFETWSIRVQVLKLAARIAYFDRPEVFDWTGAIGRPLAQNLTRYSPWLITPAMLFGTKDCAVELSELGRRSMGSAKLSFPREVKEHFALHCTQALRTCLVSLSDQKLTENRKMVERVSWCLDWINFSYLGQYKHSYNKDNEIRILLSYSDLLQCMRVLTGANNVYDRLAQVKDRLYRHIKTTEIKSVIDTLDMVVPNAPRPWHVEGTCIFDDNDYPLNDLSGPKNAALSVIDACVKCRATYKGAGWRSWVDLLFEFGRYSRLQELRDLAAFALVHSDPTTR